MNKKGYQYTNKKFSAKNSFYTVPFDYFYKIRKYFNSLLLKNLRAKGRNHRIERKYCIRRTSATTEAQQDLSVAGLWSLDPQVDIQANISCKHSPFVSELQAKWRLYSVPSSRGPFLQIDWNLLRFQTLCSRCKVTDNCCFNKIISQLEKEKQIQHKQELSE